MVQLRIRVRSVLGGRPRASRKRRGPATQVHVCGDRTQGSEVRVPKGARRVWSDGVASLFLTAWRGPDGELLIDLDWRITPPGKAPSLAQVA